MTTVNRIQLSIALFLMTAGAWTAHAAEETRAPGLVITSENDLYANMFGYNDQDRHYTQALKIMYIGGDKDFTGLTSALTRFAPKLGLQNEACNAGFAFGQNMYTPIDMHTATPTPGDWPYAGWLYGGLIFQRRGTTFNGVPTLDSYECNIGVVGPDSIADEIQRWWHHVISSQRPNGWDNQLKTEPGLELKYTRFWRLTPNEKVGRFFDVIPHLGGDLGNIRIDANAGAIVRVGYNLPHDFGFSPIESTAPSIAPYTADKNNWFSVYLFGGGEGRTVARDIFLDGNSFANSLRVDKENFVGDIIFGASALFFQHFEASFTGVIRSNQFSNQPGGTDAFGSITFKAIFSI